MLSLFSLHFLSFTVESNWITQKSYTHIHVLNLLSLSSDLPFFALLCETGAEPCKDFFTRWLVVNLHQYRLLEGPCLGYGGKRYFFSKFQDSFHFIHCGSQ